MTAYAQTYGDEGLTLTPNAFGLVYENAISENVPGQVNLHRVTYTVEGIDVVAHVYTPAGYDQAVMPGLTGHRYPAIVVAHPNGGSKDQVAGLYAQKLAEAGFVTLAFDARYQGEIADSRYMSEEAFAKATSTAEKELFIVPGATHIRTYFVKEYVDQITAKIRQFFTEKL